MSNRILSRARHAVAFALAAAPMLGGCAGTSPNYADQRTFGSAHGAVEALAEAARADDVESLRGIFGAEAGEVLSSGDPVLDRMQREVFAVAMDQRWSLERVDSNTRELIVGYEDWPFPIPLVKDSRGWWFDTVGGEAEVLARRIGRNELAAIGVLQTYVLAQREYAAERRDGQAAGVYAQKIRSDTGMRNGLYWPTDPSERPSPLGPFAAQAASEGYSGRDSAEPRPYHGYIYRVLTRQGPAAPGGAMDYVENGLMTGGFAMIAHPAAYMNSGVMTFLVGPDGLVYETDLGPDTVAIAGGISEYDPDSAWRAVE